jgi:hypothetical protein
MPFDGKLVRISVLRTVLVSHTLNTVLIPRSIRRISGHVFPFWARSTSLVFELWSELELIGPTAFQQCPLQCIFIPQSLDFIGSVAFSFCTSIACAY